MSESRDALIDSVAHLRVGPITLTHESAGTICGEIHQYAELRDSVEPEGKVFSVTGFAHWQDFGYLGAMGWSVV